MRSNTYKLTRKNPVTGFIETCHYTGSLKNAPAGWYWSGLPKDKMNNGNMIGATEQIARY